MCSTVCPRTSTFICIPRFDIDIMHELFLGMGKETLCALKGKIQQKLGKPKFRFRRLYEELVCPEVVMTSTMAIKGG
jgi:hypothetical protein